MTTVVEGDFEWDAAKAFVVIGRATSSRVLLVVHCEVGSRVRIISARTPKLPETSLRRYDWSRARRGHWAGKLRTPRAVLIAPDLYAEFGSDAAVVAALEALVVLKKVLPSRKRRSAA